MHEWTKQTKGAGFSNMIMQKLDVMQLANWISGKKVSQAKTKEKKKSSKKAGEAGAQ